MLSRHAEGMFWLGRYVERAADITRMLDTAYNAALERSARSSDRVWRDLLHVLYLEEPFAEKHGESVTSVNVNQFLIFDHDNPSSVARSAHEARTNVMNVRDAIPLELLEAVNRLHARLVSGNLADHIDNPHEIYELIAEHCRSITGAIVESMSRNDEYRFVTLGRLLERAEMTCRMIDVNRASTDIAIWMSVLRSVSGFHAFVKAHGALAQVDEVVRFLLQETAFPFSVFHCLDAAGDEAAAVSGTGTWKSPRELGRVTAELRYAEIPPVGSESLGDLIAALEHSIRTVSEVLTDDLYQFGREPALYSFEAL